MAWAANRHGVRLHRVQEVATTGAGQTFVHIDRSSALAQDAGLAAGLLPEHLDDERAARHHGPLPFA
jgi:hypothetical protein